LIAGGSTAENAPLREAMATTDEIGTPRTPQREIAAPLARLRALAEEIPDQAFGGRLWRIYESAAAAVAALGYLELTKYEDFSEEAPPDLSMWEEVAPVISRTLMDVNRLLATVRELFPAGGAGGIGDLIGEAIGEGGAREALLLHKKEETSRHVQALAEVLSREIANLGERVRSPQVVSDRWTLLADLQEFRGKFRSAIGEAIYLTASAFAPVSQNDVVPGWAEDVRDAVAARRSVTDLARLLSVHSARIRSLAPPERPAAVAELTRDLDVFGRSRSYGVLRSADKRRFVEFRKLLRRSASDPTLDMAEASAEFATFAQSLANINRRSCLMEHDRELLAACCVKLENADAARRESPERCAALLGGAVRLANDLYGRSPPLDAYLRKAKKRDYASLNPEEAGLEIEAIRELFAGAMAF
jgi:hypothetical protein